MKEEELLVDRQKKIIDRIVDHLSSLGTDMYYESTMNICREIHEVIHHGTLLKVKEKEDVLSLSPNDIQTLLSYNSSCC